MSLNFKIKKQQSAPAKTIEITPDDFESFGENDNEINFNDLNDVNIAAELDALSGYSGSGVSVHASNNKGKDFFSFKQPAQPVQPVQPPVQPIPVQRRPAPPPSPAKKPSSPIIEPDSMEFGLDMITNQKKKIIVQEEETLSEGSRKSDRSVLSRRRSNDKDKDKDNDNDSNTGGSFDFDEEKLKKIMENDDDNNSGSGHGGGDDDSSRSSALSDKIKAKAKAKAKAKQQQSSTYNEMDRKEELLFLFRKLEKKGVTVPQKFSMRSSVEEMEKTYDRLKHERDVQNSIKFQRKVLMGVVSTVEFLNGSMNPFDIDLDGWSESIMENYAEYDDIFEELYEKYKNKGHISPEVKLLMTLAGSAFYFHLSKMILKPAQQKMQEMFHEMEGGGGGGNGGGGMPDMGGFMSGLFGNFMKGGGGGNANGNGNGNGMRGPQGFDDVLSEDIPSVHSTTGNKGAPPPVKRGAAPPGKRSLHF